jgi:hypothetical protein
MKPGATAFAVMPSAPSDVARLSVQACSAAFAAPYEPAPRRAAIDVIVTIRPPGRASSGSSASTAKDHDLVPVAGEPLGHRAADAGAPAGDHDEPIHGLDASATPVALGTVGCGRVRGGENLVFCW